MKVKLPSGNPQVLLLILLQNAPGIKWMIDLRERTCVAKSCLINFVVEQNQKLSNLPSIHCRDCFIDFTAAILISSTSYFKSNLSKIIIFHVSSFKSSFLSDLSSSSFTGVFVFLSHTLNWSLLPVPPSPDPLLPSTNQ